MLFFFHLSHNGEEVRDDSGTELTDVVAARREAVSTLCGIAYDQAEEMSAGHAISLHIETKEGTRLGSLSLSFDEVPPDWGRPG